MTPSDPPEFDSGTGPSASGNGVPAPPVDPQVLADAEQTLAEADQTLADADQTSSDSDQTSAESDQIAADQDQIASDDDLAAGSDPAVHEHSRDIRERTARQRTHTAMSRLAEADSRDAAAQARDAAADARDRAAEARDAALRRVEDAATDRTIPETGLSALLRASEQRRRAADLRAVAATNREGAAADRLAAAEDRKHAAQGRERSLVDRQALMVELVRTATDPVTGARMRAPGLADLEHEIARCRRSGARLSVAYVDVIGLKARNDSQGHGAGDELLRRIVTTIKEHLRPYDRVIRIGGDEFLCTLSGAALEDARDRMFDIASVLSEGPDPAYFTAGFTELREEDTVSELAARADADLIERRRRELGEISPSGSD